MTTINLTYDLLLATDYEGTKPSSSTISNRMGIEHVPAWNMDSSNLFGASWVVCNYCNEKTDMTRCRLVSKGQGPFKCGKCCTTTTTLNRFLGHGVAQTLQNISPAEREQFWKFARENNARAIKEKITFLMRRHETWENRYQSGGNYLPLSVWATQDYDTQRIERL